MPPLKRSRFVDFQTSEETQDGKIIDTFNDDDEDFDEEENEEDRAFINDDPESDEHISDCSSVHDSEKECCEDDLILIEDNKKKNRKSRIRRVIEESSDDSEDSFIDDSDVTTVQETRNKKELPLLAKKPIPVPTVPKPRTSTGKVAASTLFAIKEWVTPDKQVYKPKASADWNFLNKQAVGSKSQKSASESKSTSGIIKTSDGDFLVKNGKRHKMTDGNVCWSNKQ
jgi:hypothetical protein